MQGSVTQQLGHRCQQHLEQWEQRQQLQEEPQQQLGTSMQHKQHTQQEEQG